LSAGTEAKVGLLTSKGMSGLKKLSVLPNEGALFCSSKISSESDELFDSSCVGMSIYSPFLGRLRIEEVDLMKLCIKS
jgi:hypothetical protein